MGKKENDRVFVKVNSNYGYYIVIKNIFYQWFIVYKCYLCHFYNFSVKLQIFL